MQDCSDPIQMRQRSSLRVRYGNHRNGGKSLERAAQLRKIKPPMQRRHKGRGLTREQRKRMKVEVEVKEIELRCAPEHLFKHRNVEGVGIGDTTLQAERAWPDSFKPRACDESPLANRVTSCPSSTKVSVSQEITRSVPPYRRGGTASYSGAICAIRIATSISQGKRGSLLDVRRAMIPVAMPEAITPRCRCGSAGKQPSKMQISLNRDDSNQLGNASHRRTCNRGSHHKCAVPSCNLS